MAVESDISPVGKTIEKASQITQKFTEACDSTTPRRLLFSSRQPNYWWNDEIISLQAACFRTMRPYQSLGGNPGTEDREGTHKRGDSQSTGNK